MSYMLYTKDCGGIMKEERRGEETGYLFNSSEEYKRSVGRGSRAVRLLMRVMNMRGVQGLTVGTGENLIVWLGWGGGGGNC